jgi:protein-disulfide isomerase
MAEHTDQHEPAHDERLAPDGDHEHAPKLETLTRDMRRPRLVRLSIAVALAVAVFVAMLLATSGGVAPPKPGSERALSSEQTISALLAGIPEHSNVLGKPMAPVTLRWFGDMECPFCKEFALGALPKIIRKWVRGGQLKIEYSSLETATRQPAVFRSQEIAALAAGDQQKMWYFLETFYHEQGEENSGYVTEQYLRSIASQISGLNLKLWVDDRHDPQFLSELAADLKLATIARFRSTPSFLISSGASPAKRFHPRSLISPAPFNEAIEYLLRRRVTAVPNAIPARGSNPQASPLIS